MMLPITKNDYWNILPCRIGEKIYGIQYTKLLKGRYICMGVLDLYDNTMLFSIIYHHDRTQYFFNKELLEGKLDRNIHKVRAFLINNSRKLERIVTNLN